MLKWRRVSTGGCWEISLTMLWLTRTHSHTHTQASSPVEALFRSLSQFSHIIWIHLNVVWLKPISLHQKRIRWMKNLTIKTSARQANGSVAPLWKRCPGFHVLVINTPQVILCRSPLCTFVTNTQLKKTLRSWASPALQTESFSLSWHVSAHVRHTRAWT